MQRYCTRHVDQAALCRITDDDCTLPTCSLAVSRARSTAHVTTTVGRGTSFTRVVGASTRRTRLAVISRSGRGRRSLSATERRREVWTRHLTTSHTPVTCMTSLSHLHNRQTTNRRLIYFS